MEEKQSDVSSYLKPALIDFDLAVAVNTTLTSSIIA